MIATNVLHAGPVADTGTNHPREVYVSFRDLLAELLLDEWERLASHLQRKLRKDASDDVDDALADYDQSAFSAEVNQQALTPLMQSYLSGVGNAEASLGITWGIKSRDALRYAQQRAAELVGRRYLDGGRLVPNHNAKWAVTQTTRDDLRRMVHDVIDDGSSTRELKQRIEQHPAFGGLFGEYRADMIARTELGLAANAGTLATFDRGGIERVRVLDGTGDAICAAVANTIQTLAWAKANPLGHPNCRRAFNAVLEGGTD